MYERAAPVYDRIIPLFERLLLGDGRAWTSRHALGNLLEIGMGTGRNLPLYPTDTLVTGIDVSPSMLDLARNVAAGLGRRVHLRVGDAQRLDFPDGSFDTVVSTLTLCSIPDEGAAVAEAFRVLRPGRWWISLEHVRSPMRSVRAVQWLLNPLFTLASTRSQLEAATAPTTCCASPWSPFGRLASNWNCYSDRGSASWNV
jgi:ubiquinone/menaquinone biosynthesis C-methylase UbiE